MDIGNRMKDNYENRYRFSLTRRVPVIIRLDGKSFHSFTKGFRRPFDELLYRTMTRTGLELVKNIQGSKIAYIQSDEISILLIDYYKLNMSAYFDYNINKVNSVTSSMATLYFNRIFREEIDRFSDNIYNEELKVRNRTIIEQYEFYQSEYIKELNNLYQIYKSRVDSAIFDCRCFNIPELEVTNYFIWRQLDATRNSIEMFGQKYYNPNQLKGVSCNQIQEMLFKEYKINWNNNPAYIKRGSSIIRDDESGDWIIDEEIPIFTSDRNYIERFLSIADKE